ncbi:MAG: NAD(P)H-quinone oxidoreductase subunit 2, chloroplastic [Bryobacteraceae bacterium]|nr:NAD(P)H-quinone oxidoreductase subunit 2, chloroplastic [Bryobacteraceae bacterium]
MTSVEITRSLLPRAAAIAVPWFTAFLVGVYRRQARATGFVAALAAVAACAFLLAGAPSGESLYEALMLLYSCLTLGAILVLPHRDCSPEAIAGILFMLGATLLAYTAESLMVLLAAWVLSTIPFFIPRWFEGGGRRPKAALLLSSSALAGATALIAAGGQTLLIDELRGKSPGGMAVFALLVAAIIFRKGILPAHAWVADAAEGGPAVPTALLLNGHFGALLAAKVIVPLFPVTPGNLVPVLSYLAMATALYVAILALTENSPRRLLAFLALSQSASILAGLESGTAEGVTGALVHWFVVTVSTVGLFAILRLLEVRFGENLTAAKHLGLAEHAPRLAVFFALFGLALVGMPGTLSFCSEDLLIHGTLVSHQFAGVLLPIATAMNAVSVFRLFTRLFLGRRRTGFTVMADALPRERWTLAVGVLFVVLGGLFPRVFVAQRPGGREGVENARGAGEEGGGGDNFLTKSTLQIGVDPVIMTPCTSSSSSPPSPRPPLPSSVPSSTPSSPRSGLPLLPPICPRMRASHSPMSMSSGSASTTVPTWWSSRSTLQARGAPMRLPITTAARGVSWFLAGCM